MLRTTYLFFITIGLVFVHQPLKSQLFDNNFGLDGSLDLGIVSLVDDGVFFDDNNDLYIAIVKLDRTGVSDRLVDKTTVKKYDANGKLIRSFGRRGSVSKVLKRDLWLPKKRVEFLENHIVFNHEYICPAFHIIDYSGNEVTSFQYDCKKDSINLKYINTIHNSILVRALVGTDIFIIPKHSDVQKPFKVADVKEIHSDTRMIVDHAVIGNKVFSILVSDSLEYSIICSNLNGSFDRSSNEIYNSSLINGEEFRYVVSDQKIYRSNYLTDTTVIIHYEEFNNDQDGTIKFSSAFKIHRGEKFIGKTKNGNILASHYGHEMLKIGENSYSQGELNRVDLILYSNQGELIKEVNILQEVLKLGYSSDLRFFFGNNDRVYMHYKVGSKSYIKKLNSFLSL